MKISHPRKTNSKSNKHLFLRCDLLRPGDVILSASGGKEGKLISTATRFLGTKVSFSHAAIVLHDALLFEAVDDGLVKTPLTVSLAGHVKGKTMILHDVSHYKAIGVWRHPTLKIWDKYRLLNAVIERAQKYIGLEYPRRTALAKAAAASAAGRGVSALGLWLIDKWGQCFGNEVKPLVPGPFCSMLVTILLTEIAPKPPLFPDKRDPADVSPNALAYDSRLEEVKDAVVAKVPGLVNNPGLITSFNQITYPELKDGMSLNEASEAHRKRSKENVEVRRTLKKAEDSVKAIKQSTDEFRKWLERFKK